MKDWQREPSGDAVRRCVEAKEALTGQLERNTAFLFCSESGLGEEAKAMLTGAGILLVDAMKLAGYEMPPTEL